MKKTFEVEWDSELGEDWINEGNLLTCLNTKTYCAKDCILSVKEVNNTKLLDMTSRRFLISDME